MSATARRPPWRPCSAGSCTCHEDQEAGPGGPAWTRGSAPLPSAVCTVAGGGSGFGGAAGGGLQSKGVAERGPGGPPHYLLLCVLLLAAAPASAATVHT